MTTQDDIKREAEQQRVIAIQEKLGGFARDKTLRDEFAMVAMNAALVGESYNLLHYRNIEILEIAKAAYLVADRMMEARK